MKKTFLILILIVISMTMYSQKAALHTASGVQIFNGSNAFINAHNAASSGDTIYLSGGTFTPPASFDKQLMIFGAGHYVDSTLATGKTFINGNVTLNENADLFYLEGVEITGNFTISNNHSVNNVIIKRCKINGTFNALGDLSNPTSNLSLIGNVLMNRLNLENIQNSLLSNNIISNTFQGSNGNMISNNIIMGFIWGSSMDYLFFGSNNTLTNNIILWEGYNANVNGSGNIFNNNLYVEPTPDYGATATSIGNYTGILQTTIFVNQTGNTFDYAHDYHLQAPTTYLGTDGTEVGIYGGTFPYKEGAVPHNPHIQLKNIAPTTNANGDLQIQIQVGAQED
ncbi:MAG: hypothetical protein QMD02_00415 [Bacteroidales bacterium]|nr:hypothetical protein [Bacteroidales bacterium]